MRAFRLWVIACQAFTILVTWNLWQERVMPPLLPALPLPSVDMGLLLLISLALIVFRPRTGIIAHSLLLVYAMLIDQTRIQPEFVSMAFLLWGTLPQAAPRLISRVHLGSLWAWAGINKLLSPVFLTATGKQLMSVWFGFLPQPLLNLSGYAIALTELALGILVFFPRTRRIAAVLACLLHIGILLTLLRMGYNSAVWGWNAALALAGFALLWNWRDTPVRARRETGIPARAVAVLLLIAPLGFYVGIVDAYLAHNLYSSNVAIAEAPISPNLTFISLNVPMPPEHRLYEQFFRLTCAPGHTMTIYDPRPFFAVRGETLREFTCGE